MQLTYLLILVCPISMGAMMWLMMRGNRQADKAPLDPRIAELEAQVSELRSAVRERTAETVET